MSDDETLLKRVASGDADAMRLLYDREAPAVAAFVRARLSDPAEVADVVHDAMLEVWRGAAGFSGRSSVRSWIFAIARNKAADRLRKTRREAVAASEDLPELPDEGPDPEAAAAAALDAERVRDCLSRLSPSHRAAIHLAFYEDLAYADIAIAEGTAVGTIKTRIFHAKQLLMHCLGRR